MKSSQQLKDLLKSWEGYSQQAYPDLGGAPTIGIGHLLTKSEKSSGKIKINGIFVKYRTWLTEKQCIDLLEQDLTYAEGDVNAIVSVDLKQNQFDALVSLTFNIGTDAFRKSTLVKVLNKSQYDQVPKQIRRWVYDNGKIVSGLATRREKEIALWNTGRGIA